MKQRICFLVDSIFTVGGVQRVTAVIARELARTNSVTIVTRDPASLRDLSLYQLGEAGIEIRHFRYPPVPRAKRWLCRLWSAVYRKCRLPWAWASRCYAHSSLPSEQRDALAEELMQGRYDVIVGVHAPLAVRLATVGPVLRRQNPKVRLVGWIHNSFEALFGPTSRYIGPELKRHYVLQMMRLDQTVVLCHHDRQQYEAFCPQFHPTVIYNPLTLLPGSASTGESRQFLAVGRFTPLHKGFDLLIEAFARLTKTESDWTLHIVGEGPEEEVYRKMIAREGLQARILLHPFTQDIQRHYSEAQVYVLSSRWEGFGLVLIEAMAHGLPVVCSDLPVCQELLGSSALYFHSGDVDDLVKQLQTATRLDWPARSAEAKSVAARFSLETIAQEWRKVLGIS
jgi:glycosyltransferase involved in cell wall biosynthesis